MSVVRPLNLPQAPLKLSKQNDQVYVWCVLRKKQLLVTPEEWVRQHLIHYLLNEKGIPPERLASEYSIRVNDMIRRCDLVAINGQGQPVLIVECKAPDVPLTEKTFLQVAQYNRKLQVEWFLFSNGLEHVICQVDLETGEVKYREDLPVGIDWLG